MPEYTVSCRIGGKLVSGLPLVRKSKRTAWVVIRDGQTGRLKEVSRKIEQHKVRIHRAKNLGELVS